LAAVVLSAFVTAVNSATKPFCCVDDGAGAIEEMCPSASSFDG
jgi:hypothetical protein